MKITISILALLVMYSSCSGPNKIRYFDGKKKYSENKSVLGLNSINADNNYYTKAVLDYLLIHRIIEGNSFVYFGTPQNLPVPKNPEEDTVKVQKMVIFPSLSNNVIGGFEVDSITKQRLLGSGVKECLFDIPKELKDLKSGLQFNHYVFKSSNKAAMQAFGIVNSEVRETSLYVVTDYLQYEDIHCSGLPKIRYAIGVRSEFRIRGVESETELKGIGSLAGLAAQVETNQMQVNITIKTIGITGIDSRLTIPSNTTFDVKTYSDYERILDFIRNLKDYEDASEKLIVEPQIIPVMDEYRTTLDHSFYPLLESIEVLEMKLEEMEKQKANSERIAEIRGKIAEIKLQMIEDEVGKLQYDRNDLIRSDAIINNYSEIIYLLEYLKNNKVPETDSILEIR